MSSITSSYKIVIPETRHVVFVNARPDEPVKYEIVINLSRTHESKIQNNEDNESALYDEDDDDNDDYGDDIDDEDEGDDDEEEDDDEDDDDEDDEDNDEVDDDEETYTTVWMELLTNKKDVLGIHKFLDGSQELDHKTCTMIKISILDYENDLANNGVSERELPVHSSVKINHGNGKDEDNQCDICVICQEELETGDIVSILDCEHLYHDQCIEEWFEEHEVCPICRNTGFTFSNMIKRS